MAEAKDLSWIASILSLRVTIRFLEGVEALWEGGLISIKE
jgi:hypothetical protein